MGIFDDIIKSAVKDTVAEMLKEEIEAAKGAANGGGDQAPGASNGETGDEKGAGGAADGKPGNASDAGNTGDAGNNGDAGNTGDADVKALVKEMFENEMRAANAAKLNSQAVTQAGPQTADDALRDLLGLGKGEDNGTRK